MFLKNISSSYSSIEVIFPAYRNFSRDATYLAVFKDTRLLLKALLDEI